MARYASTLLLVAALATVLSPSPLPADPPAADAAVKDALALQQAMQEAKYFLQHGNDSKKAVALLELQLPKVNGNADFLRLIRDAYRARVQDLYLGKQPAQAEVFLERLCVLEPGAATDPTLRPQPEAPQKVEPATVKAPEPKQASIFPDFGKIFKTTQAPVKPKVVRGVPAEDPFDVSNQRALLSAAGEKRTKAEQLVLRADGAFKKNQYGPARTLYEEARSLDPDSIADRREHWAYCVLNDAIEQLAQTNLPGKSLANLRQQVQGAVATSPSLTKSAQEILQEIDSRQKSPVNTAVANVALADLKHLGQNPEGWQVTDTPNFRIFHKQNSEFAEKVAQIAEQTRVEMARKWFGNDGAAWQPRCELIVHPTGQEYSQMTGVSQSSPGHSRIESDKSNAARVIARRMDMRLDSPGMMDAILPHETTHVVLAGQFGPFPVPRWADEGIAVLTEPAAKIAQHRQNLLRFHEQGLLFGLKELMVLQDYPESRRVSAFYAQSVMLVEFLTAQKGPVVLTSFVRDGLREGYEPALQRHYGMSFAQLQQLWSQQVLGGQKLAAGN
jgi:hypothetical protein